MRQSSIKPFPYVLEEDRDSQDEQTVFYLLPRTVEESAAISQLYSKVLVKKPGFRDDEIDPSAMKRAQVRAFTFFTIGEPGVIHYHFSDKFEDLEAAGWMDIAHDDEVLLAKLAKDLKSNQLTELFEAADRGLSNVEKKKLSCSPTTTTGSKKTVVGDETGSVITAKK